MCLTGVAVEVGTWRKALGASDTSRNRRWDNTEGRVGRANQNLIGCLSSCSIIQGAVLLSLWCEGEICLQSGVIKKQLPRHSEDFLGDL